jgi:hypothetical protein
MIKTVAWYWASHLAHGHSAAGHGGPWLAQCWIQPAQPMPVGVVRRARRGHRTREAQGGAPFDSSSMARARCVELLEHRRRVAYPPGNATRRGALWEAGRREAVGTCWRWWRSWRNLTRKSTRCGS